VSTSKARMVNQTIHPTPLPVTVVMITLNEAHTLEGALKNIAGWAQHVIVVDSYSRDATVDIALRHSAQVVQRKFAGFGDQWNFALSLATDTPWTMKMDPDERVSNRLKQLIARRLPSATDAGFTLNWRLWFMGRPMPVSSRILRIWRTGCCKFTSATVNEQPLVDGVVSHLAGDLEHHDSPNLEHWLNKQNAYTSAEAVAAFRASEPGGVRDMTARQRNLRRWFLRIPMRYQLYFLYCLMWRGAWRSGRAGWMWSHLRSEVWRLYEYKLYEMRQSALPAPTIQFGTGEPDPRVPQY
jgi:glycosyltransferase involved in cell wall biosynthesis